MLALQGVDRLLDDFDISLPRRVVMLRSLAEQHMAQQAVGQDFRQSLGALFRQWREEIHNALHTEHRTWVHDVLARRSAALKPLCARFTGTMEPSALAAVVRSFVHIT